VFENDVERGTAREFGFGAARQQNRTESGEAADTGSDAGTLPAAGDSADASPGGGRGRDGADVLAFSAAASDFAFIVHRFVAAGVGAAWGGIEIDGVAVRENHRVQLHAKFAAALDASRALGFDEFAAEIAADRDDDAIVLRDGKRGPEIEGIAGLGSASGDSIFENDREARASGHVNWIGSLGKSMKFGRCRPGGRWPRRGLRAVGNLCKGGEADETESRHSGDGESACEFMRGFHSITP